MLITLAWRNLWRNKRRTFITMASIFFAVLLAIFMRSLQEGVYAKMIKDTIGNFTGYVQVHQDGYWNEPIVDNSFESVPEIPAIATAHRGVVAGAPRLESFALASSGDISQVCQVIGVDPGAEAELTALSSRLAQGEYFQGNGPQALIGEGLAEKLGLGVGDTIVAIGQGFQGNTAAGKYPIVGLLKFGNPELSRRIMYIPLEQAQDMYVAPNRLTSFAINLNKPDLSAEVAEELDGLLEDKGEYEVMDWKEMSPDIVQFIQADRGGGILMMAILYVVIGFGIFGTILMMTAERQYEFGVMVAIGMKKWRLSILVILETIFITLLGVLAGSIVSLPIISYFNVRPMRFESLAEAYAEFGFEPIFPTAIDPGVFITQASLVLFVSFMIALYPAWKIARLDPVTAMRS